MKHYLKIPLLLAMFIYLFSSCIDEYSSDPDKEDPLLTGAREFYETTISAAASKGRLAQNTFMSPGEVTPRWDEVSYKQDAKYQYMYIPVYAEKSYIKRHMTGKAKTKEELVRVEQYLCLRKNHESGNYSGAYITYIPSAGYYAYNKKTFAEKTARSETL